MRRSYPRPLPLIALLAVAGLVGAGSLAGCGSDHAGDGRPVAVATAPQIDNLLQVLSGPGVRVEAVVPPTADVHELELRPSQVHALEDADLILRPGRGNDAWAREALARTNARQVDVSKGLPGDERHWWMDPTFAQQAARTAASSLDAVDPAGKAARAKALALLIAMFGRVDRDTKACLATVPADRRKIVTDHDAAGAYADRYGLSVVGTISPGADPEAAPSAQRVAELVRTMRAQRVAALFPIAPHGSALSKTIAEQAGATLGAPLWADALPPAGAGAKVGATPDGAADRSTLQAAARLNGHSVAEALGARDSACSTLLG